MYDLDVGESGYSRSSLFFVLAGSVVLQFFCIAQQGVSFLLLSYTRYNICLFFLFFFLFFAFVFHSNFKEAVPREGCTRHALLVTFSLRKCPAQISDLSYKIPVLRMYICGQWEEERPKRKSTKRKPRKKDIENGLLFFFCSLSYSDDLPAGESRCKG